MTSNVCMLSTVDNPYNPISDFDNWYLYDMQMMYNSSAVLARVARTSDALTDEENNVEIERAIDTIIKEDFTNLYVKVKAS